MKRGRGIVKERGGVVLGNENRGIRESYRRRSRRGQRQHVVVRRLIVGEVRGR